MRPVVVAAGVEQIVEIDRLMGAVEIADAEMHDARPQVGTVDSRTGDVCRASGASASDESFMLMSDTFHARRATRT